MKKLLNTLYITNPEAYLSLDGENVVVSVSKEEKLGCVPFHNISDIVCFGYKGVSPALMGKCAEKGIGLCFLTPHGRFLARIEGEVRGNVLLRKHQYELANDESLSVGIAKQFISSKLFNTRWCLERVKRSYPARVDVKKIENSITIVKTELNKVEKAENREMLMGVEGAAAKAYFDSFNDMILRGDGQFRFDGRNRRPPLDPVNAMLSFAYTLLTNEITSALETVGLDPCVGFLHTLRPGRKSLALDLLEELRACYADRFVLTQINLGKIKASDFAYKENGACYLKDSARSDFLRAWQTRKQETMEHPYLKEKISWGIVPYSQALLMARFIRGDLDTYPPLFWK